MFTVERVVVGVELRYFIGWQVHRDGFWWQESHRVRSHLL